MGKICFQIAEYYLFAVHIVSLRTSNQKNSREFSQKRFIGTQLMHKVHLHQVEGANETKICANELSAIAGQ